MNIKLLAVISLTAATLTGCSATPTFQTGDDAEVTLDGLTRMEGTVMDIVWARTDIDLTSYSKIKFESVAASWMLYPASRRIPWVIPKSSSIVSVRQHWSWKYVAR